MEKRKEENYNVKVSYLFNSGFYIETKNYILIFDYYLDSVEEGEKSINRGAIGEGDLRKDKPILIFSSHSHLDHYNPVIFEYRKLGININYILSSDIDASVSGENITKLSAYEEVVINGVKIKTYGSTDIGISFLVQVDDVRIFHAGDLNWWHWAEDSKEDNEKAEEGFKEEIAKINGEKIDICFFPVDPRLGEYYYIGGERFISEINPKIFIPMHFGKEYMVTEAFGKMFRDSKTKIIRIHHRGQEISL